MTCRKTKTNLDLLKRINGKEKEKKRGTTTTKERKKTKAKL
jgi:hypothetical protein